MSINHAMCLKTVTNSARGILDVNTRSPDIPEEIYNTLCFYSVVLHKKALHYIRPQTPNLCYVAVRQNGLSLKYVLAHNLTPYQYYKICLTAVKENGLSLSHMKIKPLLSIDRYVEIFLASVTNNVRALEIVNLFIKKLTSMQYHITPEIYETICMTAVAKSNLCIEYVLEDNITLETYHKIYLHAVQRDGFELKYVRKQTEKICIAAVSENGSSIVYVHKKTPAIYLAAVKNKGETLQYVMLYHLRESTDISYYDLCLAAVKQNGDAIQYIKHISDFEIQGVKVIDPQKLTSEQLHTICMAAVKQDGYALKHIVVFKHMLINYNDICKAAVTHTANALRYIEHTSEIYNELCMIAVIQNGEMLRYISHLANHMTPDIYYDICLAAVREDEMAFEFVTYINSVDLTLYHLICLEAVTKEGMLLSRVDDEILSDTDNYYKICLAAVTNNPMSLSHVIKNALTPDYYYHICLTAVTISGCCLSYVKSRSVDSRSVVSRSVEFSGDSYHLSKEHYYAICLAAVKQDGTAIQYLWTHSIIQTIMTTCQYEELCMEAVKSNPEAIQFVTNQEKYLELENVREYPYTMKLLKDCDKTKYYDACLRGVTKNGLLLCNVSTDRLTDCVSDYVVYRDICFAAVRQNGEVIKDVNISCIKDYDVFVEMCLAALNQTSTKKDTLTYILDTLSKLGYNYHNCTLYYDLCLAAVTNDGMCLEIIQTHSLDDDKYHTLCLAAVKNCGRALMFVIKQTHDICLAAVTNNPWAIQYVLVQTEDICLAAVKGDGVTLSHVIHKTRDICLAAVRQKSIAIMFIDSLESDDFVMNIDEVYKDNIFLMKSSTVPDYIVQELSVEKECDICFQDNQRVLVTPCKHELCYKCLMSLPNYMCPFCRANY